MEADPAFLSLLAAPPELPPEELTAGLARASGIGLYEVRQRLVRPVPVILGAVSAARGEEAARFVVEHGGSACAPRLSALHALPRAERVTAIEELGHEVRFALADEATATVERGRILLGIQAILREEIVAERTTSSGARAPFLVQARVMESLRGGLRTWEVLELWTDEGRRLRLAEDALRFDVLGRSMQSSARRNFAALLELLRAWDAGFPVDTTFSTFRPLGGLPPLPWSDEPLEPERASHPGAFEFYARWRWLVLQHGEARRREAQEG